MGEREMSALNIREQQNTLLKESSKKVLILLFLNTTLWMLGTFLFIHLQAASEAEHQCGVRKVQRGFVDDLWEESRLSEESEWKSSARRRIMQFESQIYSAVEAGQTSSSGQNVWSVPNTFVYVFSLSTTIGYGHLTPAQPAVRLVSLLYGLISLPLLAALVAQLTITVSSIINLSTTSSSSSPSFLLLIFSLFLLAGVIIFSLLFQWEPADSLYFVMTTLTTIGFGDILPGDSLTFLLCGGYIVLGLALFSLWQQSVVNAIDSKLSQLLAKKEMAQSNGAECKTKSD